MRRLLSCLLMTGLVGCGGSSTPPQEQATAQSGTEGQVVPVSATDVAPAQADAAANPNRKTLTPEQALTLSQQLVARRDFDNALKVINEVIRANPKLADAYVTRAAIYSENKLLTRAVDDMSAAISLAPENSKYLNTRGYFHLLQKNYLAAREDFTAAVGLDLQYAQPYNNRGLVRIALGEFKEAVRDFDNAIQVDPKYVDALNNRGFAQMQLGQLDESIASFTQALEVDPQYTNALNNRGQARYRAGDFAKAAEDFTAAIAVSPGNLAYYTQRADAYRGLGNEVAAREDLNHVEWTTQFVALSRELARAPRDPQAWTERGQHLYSAGKTEQALADLDRAIEIDAHHEAALIARARVWHLQGKVDEAVYEVTQVLKRSGSLDAYSARGDFHFAAGDYTAAINDYTAAQRLDSQVAEAYVRRADLLRKDGQIQQASADLEQAASIDPEIRTADGTRLEPKPKAEETAAAPFPEIE